MSRQTFIASAAVLLASLLANPAHAALIGDRTDLSTLFHQISGTVTVVDDDTFRVDNFTYDGQAPAVYFYLGADDTNPAYIAGLQASPLLSGTAYDGTQDALFYDLPAGSTFADYNAISVWCAQFAVNFGSGTFSTPLMGDPNGDGFIGIDDLNLVLANWNQTVTPYDWQHGELTGDNFVGIDDLNAVLGNWNAGTPPAPSINAIVPEPATLTTLALLTLLCAKPPRKH